MPVLFRRVLPLLTAIQLVCGVLILVRGFPYFGSAPVRRAPLWELPVTAFHLPAITTLSLTGHCCGLGRGMVIGPRIRAGHIRLTAGGASILFMTNWLAWISLALIVWGTWRRWRRAPASHDRP